MALSPSFTKLWSSTNFRSRLTAVIVDEAHCVDEWGTDNFRPQYQELEVLRGYTGQEIPFVACTATCTTSTFDTLWRTLAFGYRPFWGLDVGVLRPNLFFQTRILENHLFPVLDILDIFPKDLSDHSTRNDLPKCLLYFDTEGECREACHYIRKFLPIHLRRAVDPFSSSISTDGKEGMWDDFLSGKLRILCATDAAGMGCNVPDVEYVVSFGIPKSVSQVFQRWGRAARNRDLRGTCLLLVPSWAMRPGLSLNPALGRVSGSQTTAEPKQNVIRRANLAPGVEALVNLESEKAEKRTKND